MYIDYIEHSKRSKTTIDLYKDDISLLDTKTSVRRSKNNFVCNRDIRHEEGWRKKANFVRNCYCLISGLRHMKEEGYNNNCIQKLFEFIVWRKRFECCLWKAPQGVPSCTLYNVHCTMFNNVQCTLLNIVLYTCSLTENIIHCKKS